MVFVLRHEGLHQQLQVAVVLPELLGARVQGELDVVDTEGDVNVLVGGVVGIFNGINVSKNTLQHVVHHLIAQIIPDQHDVCLLYTSS